MSAAFDALRRVTAPWIERPLLALPVPWTVQRRAFALTLPIITERLGLRAEWRDLGGIPARVTLPEAASGRILYLHGGGFVMGSPDGYAGFAGHLARATGMEVWVPRYRLAPEHPWPAAPDDTRRAARAMPGPFHLAGDSAGGTLALVVLQDMLARGTAPQSVTLISPGTDLRPDRQPASHRELLFSEDTLRRFQRAYVAGADATDPTVSPVFGSYRGAPRTLIEIAEGEFLESDARRLAKGMQADGVAVALHAQPGVPHDYHIFAGRSAAADRALVRIAGHIGQ
ncbi:alpha/beta hydrolase [Jannaschia sp. KMU-145]|uniref:alpha/beta hydrolase n=1 Tax=Jannaschia halovivens TaxID=3388667 RepID=UPI00396B1F27